MRSTSNLNEMLFRAIDLCSRELILFFYLKHECVSRIVIYFPISEVVYRLLAATMITDTHRCQQDTLTF
jgi:hypothetical protein